jgi:hypothetical protein
LLDTLSSTRARLSALSVAGAPDAPASACALGGSVSRQLPRVTSALRDQPVTVRSTVLAAADRFESHVLAATLLEGSDASPASIIAIVQRGIDHLEAELAPLSDEYQGDARALHPSTTRRG